MRFETVSTGGCRSYVIGCEETCAAALIDPELSQIDRYTALATRDGLRIKYLVDTHTHADHFSATQQLAIQLGVPDSGLLRVWPRLDARDRHTAPDGFSGCGRSRWRHEGLARSRLPTQGRQGTLRLMPQGARRSRLTRALHP